MRKIYERPNVIIEEFMPNECVAACWKVACIVGNGNYGGYDKDKWGFWDGVAPIKKADDDHTGSCKDADNNFFSVNSAGEVIFDFEHSHEQNTNLFGGCTHLIDSGDNVVGEGDIIFWYTAQPGRRWNHYGVVEPVDAGHPNHS